MDLAALAAAAQAAVAGDGNDPTATVPAVAAAKRMVTSTRRRRASTAAAGAAHDQVHKAQLALKEMKFTQELQARDQEIAMLHHEMDALRAQDDAEEALIAAAADEFADGSFFFLCYEYCMTEYLAN